jgi:DNA gyrase subunit B
MGNQEIYFEKDAQLEELLVRNRVGDLEISDRSGEQIKLSEARWSRFIRALSEFEGWSNRLRSDFGAPAADFMIAHRLVESESSTADDVIRAIASLDHNGYTLSVLEHDGDGLRVKVVETETSAAKHVTVPFELLTSPIYANVRRTYAKLVEAVGTPPFTVRHGKKSGVALSFEQLRATALELAKEGIHVSRFKGLGEMNDTQLWETTMNPARRLLIRVEVEDASEADRLFSMLMGDQVEPRREFIERNARDVRVLDV